MDSSTYSIRTPTQNVNNMSAVNTARQSSDPLNPELQAFGPRSRSCVHCRSKKIKCDRQVPCTGCVRSGSSCKFPAGPGRAPKRPRETADSRIFDRLSRLELLMKQMRDDRGPEITQRTVSMQQRPENSQAGLVSDDEQSSVDQQLGRLIIDDTRSCYVSNKLWANLTSEIEELRDLLREPTFDTDEIPDDSINRSVSDDILNLSSNAAVMGLQNIASSMSSYHPSLSQSVVLVEVFKERVLPLVHIFHLPTLMHHYWDAVASLDTLDRNSEALLFAIYYSTVISMDSEQCESVVGAPREVALRHYQFAVQQAMARADLLNTQSMVLLQAVVLFLSALRNVDPSRRTWSMTALIFHTARAMGLHRDGTAFGLPPFETELRRRLWWHICFLDIRSSEHHGCQPIVQDSAFDTRMPLNINDSDLVYGMKEAPLERKEATEMTFCIIRCEVLRVAWKISYFSPSYLRPDQHEEASTSQGLERMTQELQEKLEEQYLKYCDPSVPFFNLTINVARIIIARMWLAIYYPPEQKCSPNLAATSRDNMFTTAIDILELSTTIIDTPELAQWAWHSKTHIQWHAVVIVLAEICSRPPSTECDRAWEYTNMIYNKWNLQNDNRSPWISIKRLMAKARRVREIQQHTERETNLKANLSTSFHSGTEPPTISQKAAGETLDPEGYDEEILLEPLNVDQNLLNKAYDEIESMYNDYTMGDWIKNDCDLRFSST